ncbi:MAG: LytTR family DNA-binding domain-containing protein [Allomuricauda sp.]
MRKDKLYLLTFLSVAVIYLVVTLVATSYFLESTSYELIDSQLEFAKKEAKTFATLVSYQLLNGASKDSVAVQAQKGLQDTHQNNVFLSIIDWSGKIVCHPEIQNVGQDARSEKSLVSSVADNLTADEFYTIYKEVDMAENDSEVTFMYPIESSDWIVVSHINLKRLNSQLERLKYRFYTIFSIIGLIIIPTFVMTTRYIGGIYEKRLELQKQELEDEVFNLSKLNRAVGDYQQKVTEHPNTNATKKRILTQLKNELLSIPIEEIAQIYTENSITYVVDIMGKKSTSNSSLDELFSHLDENTFFRANRQFIIAISSITKIVKYGNNQLKILVDPETHVDILISKNKAAEFKNWLNS